MRVEDKSTVSSLSGASLHPLLICLDMLPMFTGHVYAGELLAEIPKFTTPKLLVEQDTLYNYFCRSLSEQIRFGER